MHENTDTFDRRTVLKAGGLAVAAAGGIPVVTGSASADELAGLDLTDGEQTFTSANYSTESTSASTWALNQARADTQEEYNSCEASVKMDYQPDPHGQITARAETGVQVEVSGAADTPVEITVSGRVTAKAVSSNGATASVTPRLRVEGTDDDVSDAQVAESFTVSTEGSGGRHSRTWYRESFEATTMVWLTPGNHYSIGLENEARVSGEYNDTGVADASYEYHGSEYDGFDGGVSWDEIVVRPRDIVDTDVRPDDSSVDVDVPRVTLGNVSFDE